MVTVAIVGWHEGEPLSSGWGEHAPAQFRKELRRSVSLPIADRRDIERRVKAHDLVTISGVHEDCAHGLRVILEALGAKVAVDEPGLGDGTDGT